MCKVKKKKFFSCENEAIRKFGTKKILYCLACVALECQDVFYVAIPEDSPHRILLSYQRVGITCQPMAHICFSHGITLGQD